MIVIAIIMALFLLLLPLVNMQWNRWRDRQASLQINTLAGQLETYHADNRGYPTTEQGLMALVFIPDNVGLRVMPTPGVAPGTGTGMPGMQDDPTGGMMGGSVGIGPDALMQPNQMDPASGMMGQGGMGGVDPMMGSGGMMSGQMTATWTEPRHNPQLYTQQRMRPNPYVRESDLLDPWGRPFLYDNSRAFFGLNATGTERPAIWSVGRDGIDGTDDDILGWDLDEAAELIARQQRQLQQQQGNWGQQQGFDPMMQQQGGFDPMMQPQGGFDPGFGGAPAPGPGFGGAPAPGPGFGGAPAPGPGFGGAPAPGPGFGGAPAPGPGFGGAPAPGPGFGGVPAPGPGM